MELNWIESNLLEDTLDARAYQQKFIKNILDLIKSGINTKKLDELCKNIYRGNTPEHQEEYDENSALLLKTVNIRSNELDINKCFYMTNTIYNDQGRFKLNEKDICITIMGATDDIVGRSWVYNKALGKACFSDGIAKIEDVKIDPYYLSTYINSKFGHLSIIQWAGSSTRSYITNNQLGKISIPIPSSEIQKYIGDKVRKAEELREEAKRLKKEAEDILSNEINRIPIEEKGEIKGHWINFNMIDDRIDGDFYSLEYEILEKIDEFYDCISLEKLIVEKFTGKTPNKSEDSKNGIPLLLIKNMEENLINKEEIERKIRDSKELKKTKQGDMLITRVGNGVGITAIVEEYDVGIFISDNIIDLSIEDKIPKRYVSFYLNSKYGKLMIERWNKGAVQPVINYQSINKFKIPILEKYKMERIDECIVSWKEKNKLSKQLIQQAKQDIEDLIEGNFDTSKIKEINEN